MTSVWWIRRDARLADNPALLEAQADGPAAAVFPWSPPLVRWSGRRRAHLARVLWSLREDSGGRVGIRQGAPAEVVLATAQKLDARVVWAQREFAPSAVREQDAVASALAADGRELRLIGSPYAVAPGRVTKADGNEYLVFTPFARAWREHGWRGPAAAADPALFAPVTSDVDLDQLAAHGDVHDPLGYPMPFTEADWTERLADFVAGPLASYASARDRPDLNSTSHLSVPLAHGQLHPRTILAATARAVAQDPSLTAAATSFTSELAWREFHADVLHHHPRALRESLTPVLPDHAWVTDATARERLAAWQAGETGFPLVDAGMREARATGVMHNRVRMVVASFLVKDLHVPWQVGADYFRRVLLDYDHAQNQLNWQWVAGTGRDAAPYFRIFNPDGQRDKHDPDEAYVRRWLPDLDTPGYPERIVDHAEQRALTLAAYRAARAG